MNSSDESKLMAQEISRYISERRDKKELALLKEKPNKGIGGINIRLTKAAETFFGKSHEPLKILISKKKDKAQSALEFQQSKYQALLFLLGEHQIDNLVLDITQEYRETLHIINQEHVPTAWLNQWAVKASDISFATHVAKLTHSSSKGSSIFDKTTSSNHAYLTTNMLKWLETDTATANAASAPAGEILTLQINDKSLLDYVKEDDRTAFEHLTDNKEYIENWISCFKQAYDSDHKTSHFLSKQVYYPIENQQYHLLLPLVSSTMAHALFLKFRELSNEGHKSIREQKSKKKFDEKIATSYSNKATLTLTRSVKAHSNISSLNKDRFGELTLLPCSPPKWQSNEKLSLNQTNLFNRQLSFKLKDEVKDLQRLLLVIKSKGIGSKKPEMHQAIVGYVSDIAQAFFVEIIKFSLLNNEKGWTQKSSLTLPQQLLLEPGRDDEEAIQERNKKQWLSEVSDDFAEWLNRQLKHKQLNLTLTQQRLWKDVFSPQLREFIATQE
ncbi:MAG: type I-F CRISPR-associated protein Csy1 [Gammaproteobacteria bacterium]|nr:type I-F CRISPR-associated protein Csy1 [Gammaproteobacteria bacterium]